MTETARTKEGPSLADKAPTLNDSYQALHRLYPTIHYLRARAAKRLPCFVYDFGDGGAGADAGIARNWAAFDAVELVPRYGVTNALPPIDVELFGKRYGAPFGVPPIGGASIVWPGAERLFAKAAQRADIPYILGVAGGATIEEIGEIAPDVFWFQLYRFFRNDHAIGFDMVRRAEAANAQVLVLTLDAPVRTTRSRECRAGLANEFKPDLRMMWDIVRSPAWLAALLQNGFPRFATIRSYVGEGAGTNEVVRFARREMGGAFSWDDVARYRDRWKRPFVIKGVLHPADAEKAVALGADGIIVSNHGGRQIDALPPSIDCLPAVARAVGGRATLMLDSGVRSGTDIVRALALGASAVFAGKAFLWGVGALGEQGAAHVIDLLMDETRASLGQVGAQSVADARSVIVRHPNALRF